MQLEAPKPKGRAMISLTPLIDVVFILLVFFMLATSFLDWTALPLSVPAQSAAPVSEVVVLNVRIDAEGQIFVDDVLTERSVLGAELSSRVADEPELHVLVKPDPAVDLQMLVNVVDAVRLASPGSMRLAR